MASAMRGSSSPSSLLTIAAAFLMTTVAQTKRGCGFSPLIWKLMRVAEQSWRKLNAPKLMQKVYEGKLFRDGIAVKTKIEPTRKAA